MMWHDFERYMQTAETCVEAKRSIAHGVLQ